jgi:hypothetical protein
MYVEGCGQFYLSNHVDVVDSANSSFPNETSIMGMTSNLFVKLYEASE